MKFTFIRHGQTDAVLFNLICGGAWDVPLNSNGRAESQELALVLKKAETKYTTIIASPSLRTKETAEIIAELLRLPIIYSNAFDEQNLGLWEKQPVRQNPFFSIRPNPPAGEPYQEFSDRIRIGITELINKYSHNNFLLISHGLVWREICEQLKLKYVPAQRCLPYEVSCSSEQWSYTTFFANE